MEKRTSCVQIISPLNPHDIPTNIPNESEAALLGGDFHQLPPVSLDGWAFQAKAGTKPVCILLYVFKAGTKPVCILLYVFNGRV